MSTEQYEYVGLSEHDALRALMEELALRVSQDMKLDQLLDLAHAQVELAKALAALPPERFK